MVAAPSAAREEPALVPHLKEKSRLRSWGYFLLALVLVGGFVSFMAELIVRRSRESPVAVPSAQMGSARPQGQSGGAPPPSPAPLPRPVVTLPPPPQPPSLRTMSDADLINGMTDMCKELQVLQEAGKINYWEMWDFCGEHNVFKGVAIGIGDRPSLEQEYQTARAKVQEIKRKAGLDPNQTAAEMNRFKKPTRVVATFQVDCYLGAGTLTLTDANYRFVPHTAGGQPTENGYWNFSGARWESLATYGLGNSADSACFLADRQGSTRFGIYRFAAGDARTTGRFCQTFDQVIKEYVRLHPNVF